MLLAVIGLLVGFGIGYALAVSRTDRTLAAMSTDELNALAERVQRRKG